MSIWWRRPDTGRPRRGWVYSIHVDLLLVIFGLSLLIGLALPLIAKLVAALQA